MSISNEYRAIFALTDVDLKKRIIECNSYSALSELPFKDNEFELALSAHTLFAGKKLSAPLLLAAIKEMCRVAGEARIYPLVDTAGEPSKLLPQVMLQLQQENYGLEIKEVANNGRAMLRVWSQACKL